MYVRTYIHTSRNNITQNNTHCPSLASKKARRGSTLVSCPENIRMKGCGSAYVHTNIHVNVHTYTCTYTFMYAYMHTAVLACVFTCMSKSVCLLGYPCVNVYVRMFV